MPARGPPRRTASRARTSLVGASPLLTCGRPAHTVNLCQTITHQACTITGHGNQTFVCPCHGSQFDTSGRVLSGPAPAPLPRYQTQFANNVLTITG
jgi:Rieske Fe-S protein